MIRGAHVALHGRLTEGISDDSWQGRPVNHCDRTHDIWKDFLA